MAMIAIRNETHLDVAPREDLLDAAFGDARFTKTAQRLRDGRLPAAGLSFVARANKRLVGTVRLWDIAAGAGRPALLLGPLAVAHGFRHRGIGAELMRHALDEAGRRGAAAVLLVGDAPYYGRFGFSAEKTGALWLPGPYDRERLLAHEFAPGALDGARGLISATGQREPRPDPAACVADLSGSALASHAA
jgi:predicted N-acetyltransferase YhbS